MAVSLGLITDRAQSDVDNGTAKGFYNRTDLERIQLAIPKIKQSMEDIGITPPTTVTVNWSSDWSFTAANIETLRQNVVALKAAYQTRPGTPATPATLDYPTWQKANDLEKILEDIWTMLEGAKNAWWHSGMHWSGQGGLRA